MILMNCKNMIQNPNSIRELYILLAKTRINSEANSSIGLIKLLTKYKLTDVVNSLSYTYIDAEGFLRVQEHTEQSKILRYLEYGGEGVKPTHILSDTANKIYQTFNYNGGSDVYKF